MSPTMFGYVDSSVCHPSGDKVNAEFPKSLTFSIRLLVSVLISGF